MLRLYEEEGLTWPYLSLTRSGFHACLYVFDCLVGLRILVFPTRSAQALPCAHPGRQPGHQRAAVGHNRLRAHREEADRDGG